MKHVLTACGLNPNIKLAAVCDTKPELEAHFRKTSEGHQAKFVNDYRQLIDDKEINTIINIGPTDTAYAVNKAAL